jgi:energy-coupling factor transport system substrate-specific component
MTTRQRASTRYLLTCAVLGVAGGLLTVGMNYASIGLAAVAPAFIAVTIGAWVLPSITGLALLQRPGAGFLIALLGGLINAPLTPYGFAQLPTVVMVGLLSELPFAVTLYRVWAKRVFYIGYVILITAFSTLWLVAVDAAMSSPVVLVVLYALTALASAFFIWVALLLASRLRRAGVGLAVSGARAPRPAREAADV